MSVNSQLDVNFGANPIKLSKTITIISRHCTHFASSRCSRPRSTAAQYICYASSFTSFECSWINLALYVKPYSVISHTCSILIYLIWFKHKPSYVAITMQSITLYRRCSYSCLRQLDLYIKWNYLTGKAVRLCRNYQWK